MLTEITVSKLREMRLRVMADALKDQLSDPQYHSMAFEDRIGLLADAICDRIVHDAYTVVIGGKESMRKRKGLQDS